MTEAMGTLLIIQTGATEWQADQRLGGTGKLPLSDAGEADLCQHLGALADRTLDAILADDSQAAQQTATLVADRLGGKIRLIEDLRDVHMGLWEGMTEDEIRQRYPKVYRQWRESPASVTPPEGEDVAAAFGRVVRAVHAALRKQGTKRVAVVAAPMVAGLLRCWLTGCELDGLWKQVDASGPSAAYELNNGRPPQHS